MSNTAQEPAPALAQIVFVIDKLESGGAQRQLVMLATALKDRGYGVEVFVYHRDDFFADDFRKAGVSVSLVTFRNAQKTLGYPNSRDVKLSKGSTNN